MTENVVKDVVDPSTSRTNRLFGIHESVSRSLSWSLGVKTYSSFVEISDEVPSTEATNSLAKSDKSLRINEPYWHEKGTLLVPPPSSFFFLDDAFYLRCGLFPQRQHHHTEQVHVAFDQLKC